MRIPRGQRHLDLELRFGGCTASMAGRRFALDSLPLRVRSGGKAATAVVRLSAVLQTACP